jgi:predicted nuclease of predicted toxin-antitoxin system
MKIKLDENLPSRLVSRLAQLGHDIHTARAEGVSGARDLEICKAAQREGCFLITQDLDFSDIRRFVPGAHCGVLLVRLREPSRQALVERIAGLFRNEDVQTWERCFVVATDRKVRVRRPPEAPSGGVT